MKVEWKSDSTDPNVETGVAILSFETGTVAIPLPSFTVFHKLTSLIQRDIDNAAWSGRESFRREVAAIKS